MNLDASATYEGFGRRLLAGLIDVFLLLVLAATVALLGVISGAGSLDEPIIAEYQAILVRQGVWWLAAAGVAIVPMWAFLGASPGMLLVGSRVVAAQSGRRLSLVQSAVRAIGLALGVAALGIGIAWCIWDPRHQGLHDKLARSVVVREDESLMTLEELVEEFE